MSGDKLSRWYQIAAWHALQVCLHATCPEMAQDITWSSGMLNPVEDSSHRDQPVEFLIRPAMLTRGLRGESLVSIQQNAPLQWTFSSYQHWASISSCWLGHRGCVLRLEMKPNEGARTELTVDLVFLALAEIPMFPCWPSLSAP